MSNKIWIEKKMNYSSYFPNAFLIASRIHNNINYVIRGQTTSEFLRGAPIADTTTHCCSRKTTKLLPMWDVYTDDESDDEHAIEMNDLVIN